MFSTIISSILNVQVLCDNGENCGSLMELNEVCSDGKFRNAPAYQSIYVAANDSKVSKTINFPLKGKDDM